MTSIRKNKKAIKNNCSSTLVEMKIAIRKEMRKSKIRKDILDLIDDRLTTFTNPNDQSMLLRIEKPEWLEIREGLDKVHKKKATLKKNS